MPHLGPRADFSCKTCQVTYEDLPVACVRCPVCNRKRGFVRLFNAINIGKTPLREAVAVTDMLLEPAYDKHSAIKAGAKRFESMATEAQEKAYAKATPQERPHVPKFGPQVVPAAQALGMVPPQSRADSRTLNYPMMKRHVVPQWHDPK